MTLTEVEVSADLSHATVLFTHLAGKEHAAEAVDGAGAHGRLPAQRARPAPRSVLGAAARFVYDDSIECGMRLSKLIDEAVAADKKLEG